MVKSLASKISIGSSNISAFNNIVGNTNSVSLETKNRNDPGRFFGDGVQFKAKLIGILEVGEARGDRMCQEALQDLKMAIRAAGEHKQRITIHVTIDGLRLRDEKTGDSLYHHPVHKISFIAQDMTDSRAFGYIFGSPDSGHRFFGIKTDKAASQVVLAMRDLFQVVFELKKKEIELARQQIQSKAIHDHQLTSLTIKNGSLNTHNSLSGTAGSGFTASNVGESATPRSSDLNSLGAHLECKGVSKELSPESVADLVDLEQELNSIQRGITQMERITPNDVSISVASGTRSGNDDDPFGDSFTNFPAFNLLPPPESGRRNKNSKTSENINPSSCLLSSAPTVGVSSSSSVANQENDDENWLNEIEQRNHVFDTAISSNTNIELNCVPITPLVPTESAITTSAQQSNEQSGFSELELCSFGAVSGLTQGVDRKERFFTSLKSDAFTDLDPLGTGRTRPYVDRKYFFQELKNPPKKVLKDLSNSNSVTPNLISGSSFLDTIKTANYAVSTSVDIFLNKDTTTAFRTDQQIQLQSQENQHHLQPLSSFNSTNAKKQLCTQPPLSTTGTSMKKQNLSTATTMTTSTVKNSTSTNPHLIHYNLDTSANDASVMMSHETDPFSPTRKKSDPDPFPDGDIFSKQGKFEAVEASDSINNTQDPGTNPTQPQLSLANTTDVFNSPLQVSLPPENSGEAPSCQSTSPDWRADISYLEIHEESNKARSRPITSAQRLSVSSSSYTQASVLKQQTVDVISSISTKKMPHLFGQARFSKRDSNSINMRRLQESDSLSENETAPEPPPRPDATTYVEPPPLPPKRQLNDNITRSRIPFSIDTTMASGSISANHYESVNAIAKYNANANRDGVPPIPLPSRRLGKSDGDFPGPERPKKPGHTDDDYLTPISATTTGFCNSSKQSVPPLLPPPTHLSSRSRAQRQQPVDIYENKEEILLQQQELMKEVQCSLECNPPIVPDITLTQLLTLGIDDLAKRLNVPTSKLSTMTLVELTAYLSDFLCSENTKPKKVSQELHDTGCEAGVFKVNFDQQTTFIAKFDDTFGEDLSQNETAFVANFEQFNQSPNEQISSFIKHNVPTVPSADRYAVFREIIDQEMQQLQESTDLMGDLTPPSVDEQNYQVSSSPSHLDQDTNVHFEAKFDKSDLLTDEDVQQTPSLVLSKIDTKITEVVAQAKDRYAALRDIILVENLFDKVSPVLQDKTIISEFTEFSDEFNEDQDLKQIMDDRESSIGTADRLGIVDSRCLPAEPSSSAITVEDDEDEEDAADESSAESNEKDAELGESYAEGFIQDRYEKLSTSMQQLSCEKVAVDKVFQAEKNQPKLQVLKQDNKFLTVSPNNGLFTSKDDFEIDELMQRAISNLSLDSREIISPAHSLNLTTQRQVTVSAPTQSQYNDVSTSPIPLQTSLVENEPNKHKPQTKSSPNVPTISSQLSAVSQLIDTVSKKLNTNEREGSTEMNVNSWATFDTSKRESEINSEKYNGHKSKHKSSNSLHLPPPPPSNASINDPAESPCSSDQREEGWRKSANNRRWPKLERQQTSSSSRDISPWDDEAPDYQKHKPRLHAPTVHSDRHYYVRHTKRMNSCDEDYDYEDELSVRRDQRKFKQGLSRSRDNFDLDSPSWYHHAPYTWTAKDIEQARGRFFDRNAYERTTYGPPLFDKRGVGFPPLHSGSSSYDRRVAAGSYDKRKYYRDYGRPNYDVEEFGEAPVISDRSMYRGDSGSFEKIKMSRRPDYENLNEDGNRYKSKAEYMYERERKSFDRESLDSYDSSSRKRKSFGSGGDVYGSLENREEFRDRYGCGSGNTSKNRSLRRGTKLRVAGDIDYEQDSEGDFQQPQPRGRAVENRSLQRPNQLSTGGMGLLSSQTRVRKSSGSSPWDGEETQVIGIKQWKRPTSATESERRLVESRRTAAINALPSGSDGEKDRRFRKKHRPRGTKGLYTVGSGCGSPPGSSCSRYGNIPMTSRNHENFDYMACDDDLDDDDEDYVDDEPPTDEDKFERINRRRHEVHQKMHESERRAQNMYKMPQISYKTSGPMPFKKYQVNIHNDFDFEGDFEQNPTPISNDSSTQAINNENQAKFEFDAGFESDFKQNSPPSGIDGTVSSSTSTYPTNVNINSASTGNKSTFRFSNDFSDREGSNIASSNSLQETEQFESQPVVSPTTPRAPQPVQQKLRFDDKVKVSKFDGAAFEDDFSKATFDFNKDDQWHVESLSKSSNGSIELPVGSATKKQTLRNNKLQQRQELIKKSESINIFAKKSEDPFEDDEFFKEPTASLENTGPDVGTKSDIKNTNYDLSGESNFATFDKNM